MRFEQVLSVVGDEPVFETGLLLAGDVEPAYIRRQLSGWVESGRLWQLRRGLYALAPTYRRVTPHPFLVANRLVPGSYVSLQAALAFYGLIPEYAAVVTSVTARRPAEWHTPLGHFAYRHIQPDLLFGYERLHLGQQQWGYVAAPAKALLDLVYLQPEGDAPAYLRSLRLQNTERIDLEELRRLAGQAGRPKLLRAAARIAELAAAERWNTL
jgi:predicted transcriptional regulator of viral defense system